MAFYLPHRYEIEYDENRLEIGREIGRRFLGIDCDEHPVNAVADTVNISIVKSGNENGSGCGESGANTGTYMESNVTSGGDIGNARKHNQIKENATDEINLNCEKDELVLDVLNDDLIAKVRGRITSKCQLPIADGVAFGFGLELWANCKLTIHFDVLSCELSGTVGSKELFEPCVTAVKAFLAGEPFSEFESSMYFHR